MGKEEVCDFTLGAMGLSPNIVISDVNGLTWRGREGLSSLLPRRKSDRVCTVVTDKRPSWIFVSFPASINSFLVFQCSEISFGEVAV